MSPVLMVSRITGYGYQFTLNIEGDVAGAVISVRLTYIVAVSGSSATPLQGAAAWVLVVGLPTKC